MCGLQLLCACAHCQGVEPTRSVRARGPDEFRSGLIALRPYRFDRLHVTGEGRDGMQPAYNGATAMMANAEVFAAHEVREACNSNLKSDCGLLLDLFSNCKDIDTFSVHLSKVQAEFSALWIDVTQGTVLACRDTYGVRPLYHAECSLCNQSVFASELGALAQFSMYADTVKQVPPEQADVR